MGWANCGTDSNGRPIGYVFLATCDHPGCEKEIDRGLAFACGGYHGGESLWCEKYFCEDHLEPVETKDGEWFCVCAECVKYAVKEGLIDEEWL